MRTTRRRSRLFAIALAVGLAAAVQAAFVFDTDGPATGNKQWWTFHHDEWNSGNVTIDPRK